MTAPGLRTPDNAESVGENLDFQTDVGDRVGLLLLLFLKLLFCLINEDIGKVAFIGPCLEEGDDSPPFLDFRTH